MAKKENPKPAVRRRKKPEPRCSPKLSPARVLPVPPDDSGSTPRVRIRMYRVGVGDCFLITLPRAGGEDFRLLLDCGVHTAQKSGADKLRDAVADIMEETQGKLDVVVATHEHWDHISGFSQAKDQFDQCSAEEIWLAWTEDDKDPLARSIANGKHRALTALRGAETRMHLAGMAGNDNPLTSLLGFYGGGGGKKSVEAWSVLKAMSKTIRFHKPGDPPIEVPGADARFFVLGPPRDEAAIARDAPRKSGDEVYAFGAYRRMVEELEPAMQDRPSTIFDERFAASLASSRAMPFFAARYWSAFSPDEQRVERAEGSQDWRRIDTDWMGAATTLALKLDEDTNNTSLVLALELGPPDKDGPVVLFAADAQIGNWLSWQKVKWSYRGRTVTGPGLLRRTIVYKVGHHASHNATLKADGLELMDALELALITTDAEMASNVGWGRLPWKSLIERLEEKTKGNVIRSDRPLPEASATVRVTEGNGYFDVEI